MTERGQEEQMNTKTQPLEVVFHVFTNGEDIWTPSLAQAILNYKRFKKANRCARLYLEIYGNRENDKMIHENCLLSVGDYPT